MRFNYRKIFSADSNKISLEKKYKFYYMLSFYFSSDMNILSVLDLVYEDTKIGNIRKLKDDISNGYSFVSSLKNADFCDDFIYTILNIGEETGDYINSFKQISDYLENRISDRKYFMQVLSYPLFLFIFSNVVFYFLILFIIPQLHKALVSFDASIPLGISLLYKISVLIKKYVIFFIVFALLGVFSLGKKKIIKFGDFILTKILENALVKRLYNIFVLKTIFWQLSILSKNEISLLSAIEIIKNGIDSKLYKDILFDIIHNLKQGKSLYSSFLNNEKFFNKTILEYIKLGEETSNINKNFDKIYEFLDIKTKEVSSYTKQLIQPIAIIFVSIFIFIIILFILPMIDAVTSVGGI